MSDNHALCAKAVKGHPSALRFLELISSIAHLWDDLHDKDHAVFGSDIDRVFWNALVELPRNEFYQQNFVALNTTISLSIQNWMSANTMEDSDLDTDKEIAFIIRSSLVDLVVLCAMIIGGYDWAKNITTDIRREWHNETLAGYLQNLAKEQSDRKRHHGVQSV